MLEFCIAAQLVLLIVKTAAVGFALKFVKLLAQRRTSHSQDTGSSSTIHRRTGSVEFVEEAVCICFALKFV
jgi:hypothetical protein